MNDTEPILFFNGDYRWLSNFYPVIINYDGLRFPSVEHAYQAAKTQDRTLRMEFCERTVSAARAKRMGSSPRMKKPADWDDRKIEVMEELIRKKFRHENPLGKKLIETGDRHIEEGNTWGDRFWGVYHGIGHNHLGKLIMARRTQLQTGMKK